MTPRPTPLHLTVGEVARRTGMTVRTLHHYDTIGLVSPSARSDAGYRLYHARDIERLHAVQALKQLGLGQGASGQMVRGFALGTAAHGIGAASALQSHADAGAWAALALGLQAVLASLWIPLLVNGLQHWF